MLKWTRHAKVGLSFIGLNLLGIASVSAPSSLAGPPKISPQYREPTPASAPPRPTDRSLPPSEMARRLHYGPTPQQAIKVQADIEEAQKQGLPLPIYAKLIVPRGGKIMLYGNGGSPHKYDDKVKVGFRSRHRYAFALENLPQSDGRTYYGTIEVVRGLLLPKNVKGPDAAVPLVFNDQDAEDLAAHRMITKMVVVEDPDVAIAEAGHPDEAIRHEATMFGDAVEIARGLGKTVAIVRVGSRIPGQAELMYTTAENSLLIPRPSKNQSDGTESFVFADSGSSVPRGNAGRLNGQYSEPPIVQVSGLRHAKPERHGPGCEPRLDGASCDICNNSIGPKSGSGAGCQLGPSFQPVMPNDYPDPRSEYLCDGGDRGKKAGVGVGGALFNVDPMDTIAQYVDAKGRQKISVSNVVCLFAPRFAEVRLLQNVEAYDNRVLAVRLESDRGAIAHAGVLADSENKQVRSANMVIEEKRASQLRMAQGARDFYEVLVLEGLEERLGWALLLTETAPRVAIVEQQPVLQSRIVYAKTMTRVQFPQIVAMSQGVGQVVSTWTQFEAVGVEERPAKPSLLRLSKIASRSSAEIGDEVEFTIVYENTGEETLKFVAVVDNLTARLEYIPNSAKSSREAVFTAQANEVGSSELRWELKEPLAGGQSGTVTFKTRVR